MSSSEKPLVIKRQSRDPWRPENPSKEGVINQCRDLIEGLLKLNADVPEEMTVTVISGDRTTTFKVDCCQQNMARLIGKNGKTITSIRNIVTAITSKYGLRAIVDIPFYPQD